MVGFQTIDELSSFELHDSFLDSVSFGEADMIWEIDGAIVIGHSCPEIADRVPNSANDGEDRYARPVLRLTFRNYKVVSVLRGGSYSQDEDGNQIENAPPKYLEHPCFLDILNQAAEEGSEIWNFQWKDRQIGLDFMCGKNWYKLKFQTDSVIAEWESFGEEAWYLEHYRKNRETNQEK